MFIPDGKEEEEVPTVIVKLCKEYFGIDVIPRGNYTLILNCKE